MNGPIVTIRPEPGCAATVEAGRKRGLAIAGWPLFEIGPMPWTAPDPATVDGLLLGSANAIRHGGAELSVFHGKPVWAVGATTAEAARDAGFDVAMQGEGGLQSVLDRLTDPLRLLRLAGVDHVPLRPAGRVELVTRIVYESRALPLPPAMEKRLSGAVILLHSASAASHLHAEVEQAGLPREKMRLAALGPRIARAAGGGWGEVRSASAPSDDALLDLVAEMCHDPAR